MTGNHWWAGPVGCKGGDIHQTNKKQYTELVAIILRGHTYCTTCLICLPFFPSSSIDPHDFSFNFWWALTIIFRIIRCFTLYLPEGKMSDFFQLSLDQLNPHRKQLTQTGRQTHTHTNICSCRSIPITLPVLTAAEPRRSSAAWPSNSPTRTLTYYLSITRVAHHEVHLVVEQQVFS